MLWVRGLCNIVGEVFFFGSLYREKMIMRVAASKEGSSSLLASAHVWNADCPPVLSQVSAENLGPLYIGKARTVIKSTKS
jgi:hypothetical protein